MVRKENSKNVRTFDCMSMLLNKVQIWVGLLRIFEYSWVIKLFEYGFGFRIFGQFYHQQLKTSFYHLALFVFIALGILNLKMADNNNNDCKDVKTVEKRTKSLVTFLSLIYKGRSSRWSGGPNIPHSSRHCQSWLKSIWPSQWQKQRQREFSQWQVWLLQENAPAYLQSMSTCWSCCTRTLTCSTRNSWTWKLALMHS